MLGQMQSTETRDLCDATERSPLMHCANESWMIASFSMKENMPVVASAMVCIAAESWSVPELKVWPTRIKEDGTSTL